MLLVDLGQQLLALRGGAIALLYQHFHSLFQELKGILAGGLLLYESALHLLVYLRQEGDGFLEGGAVLNHLNPTVTLDTIIVRIGWNIEMVLEVRCLYTGRTIIR